MSVKDQQNYNLLGFLLTAALPLVDALEGTDQYNQQLKYHGNRFAKEAEKITKRHYERHTTFGKITQPDGTKIDMHDIYNIQANAYEFLLSKRPHEIAAIAHLVQELDRENKDYTKINIDFEPVLK